MDRIDDLKYLVDALEQERHEGFSLGDVGFDDDDELALFDKFRALSNTRPPIKASSRFLEVQDRVLRGVIEDKGVTDARSLPRVPLDSRISLWRGDITTLKVDAVVNAANSQMLGCWVPGHFCIDNAIHTFAGVQLRIECAGIMDAQGHDEPTGQAKVTRAFNLPARYVIHTVGPIANGHATERDCELLSRCYSSCMDAAERHHCKSIAFCCISTGVFGFPKEEAARIAVDRVLAWLDDRQSHMHVVFNVFNEHDERVYHELLFDARCGHKAYLRR